MHWISLVKLSPGLRKEERRDNSTVASTRTAALATVFWCLLALSGAQGLVINDSQVATVAQRVGSTDPVILDCDYMYKEEEKNGLVVKWYREPSPSEKNKTTEQVYQWIFPLAPQDLGVLKGRLNITYEVSEDPYKKHRALNIVNPTINVTGVYKCHVSTNFHDAYQWQKVVIYSPARDVIFHSSTLSGSSKVNVSCIAEGIYPEPFTEIIIRRNQTTHIVVNDTTQLVVPKEGLLDVTVYKIFDDSTLGSETQFECQLSVPDTTYRVQKTFMYLSGQGTPVTNYKNDASDRSLVISNSSSPAGDSGSSRAFYHCSMGTIIVQVAIVLLYCVGHPVV